jgi:hypothetical protein
MVRVSPSDCSSLHVWFVLGSQWPAVMTYGEPSLRDVALKPMVQNELASSMCTPPRSGASQSVKLVWTVAPPSITSYGLRRQAATDAE